MTGQHHHPQARESAFLHELGEVLAPTAMHAQALREQILRSTIAYRALSGKAGRQVDRLNSTRCCIGPSDTLDVPEAGSSEGAEQLGVRDSSLGFVLKSSRPVYSPLHSGESLNHTHVSPGFLLPHPLKSECARGKPVWYCRRACKSGRSEQIFDAVGKAAIRLCGRLFLGRGRQAPPRHR